MAAAQIRAALGRMGFSETAGAFIVNTQGYDDLDEFRVMSDHDVENLCKVTRRPGGTRTVQGNQVANLGHNVSALAEQYMKLMCYYLKFQYQTSRAMTAVTINKENVRKIKDHKLWEESHEDLDPPTELPNKDWPRNFDTIDDWLRGCLGSTGIPLAYVIRENLDPADDPAGGADNWPSKQDELVARAPIRTVQNEVTTWNSTYKTDNRKVWEKLAVLMRKLDYCWTHIKKFHKSKDGRAAFMALKTFYLGAHYVDQMANTAENKLATTFYTGERRNFTFDKFVQIHIEQHTILDGLKEQGYTGIDPRSKVRYLMNGIKTTALDSVKTRILTEDGLRSNFDRCVCLYSDFIKASNTHTLKTAGIAALHGGGHRGGRGEPDMSVEDRYYDSNEYRALSAAQKLGLKRKREARGAKGGGGGKGKRGSPNPKGMNLSKSSIAKLATAIAKKQLAESTATETETDATSDEEDEEVPMKPPAAKKPKGGNRTNKALSRKKV